MTSYFDVSDAEGLYLGPEDSSGCLCRSNCRECRGGCGFPDCQCECEVECIHGHDLFAHCDECAELKLSAADGGEGDDDMEPENTHENFAMSIKSMTPMSLVSMRNAIDSELKTRKELLQRELAATTHALNGTKPRARRSDAGRPRQKPANDIPRDEKGVAV